MSKTIDIQDGVDQIESWAVKTLKNMIWVKIVPLKAIPVVSTIIDLVLEKIVTIIVDGLDVLGFNLNTHLVTADQAKDYTETLKKTDALPPDATREQRLKAEQDELEAFRNIGKFNR